MPALSQFCLRIAPLTVIIDGMKIHPTAIIAPSAQLGQDVEVGPFAIIEDNVQVGDQTRIRARAQICQGTILGKRCDIHMNAVLGHLPQDLSFHGEALSTLLGDGVVVRENVTIHGSVGEHPTQIGDNCFLMAGSHVAHNCKLGEAVILANGALLAGHVQVGDGVFVSGNVVIHQFVRVGRMAILSGGSRFGMDIPPYLIGDGANAVTGLNAVGLRRSKNLTHEDRQEIKQAFKLLYRSDLSLAQALERMRAEFKSPAVQHWIEFLATPTRRGFCPYRRGRTTAYAEEKS